MHFPAYQANKAAGKYLPVGSIRVNYRQVTYHNHNTLRYNTTEEVHGKIILNKYNATVLYHTGPLAACVLFFAFCPSMFSHYITPHALWRHWIDVRLKNTCDICLLISKACYPVSCSLTSLSSCIYQASRRVYNRYGNGKFLHYCWGASMFHLLLSGVTSQCCLSMYVKKLRQQSQTVQSSIMF